MDGLDRALIAIMFILLFALSIMQGVEIEELKERHDAITATTGNSAGASE